MARIRLQEIAFTYPSASEPTLQPISLDIQDGEAFSLLGASGAGKTTLLNLLSGILPPTQGRIFFDDVDVTERPATEKPACSAEGLDHAGQHAVPSRRRGLADGEKLAACEY